MQYIHIREYLCFKRWKAEIEERKAVIKPVKGMMTLHVISTENHFNLIKRNTTCACCNC